MKKTIHYILVLFGLSFLLTSCSTVQEDIFINSDGSGSYAITMDMTSMLDMTAEMFADSASETQEDPMDKLFQDGQDYIDSTQSFYNETEDSIKAKLDHPELLKKAHFGVKASKADRRFDVIVRFDFDSVDELKAIMREVGKTKPKDDQTQQMNSGLTQQLDTSSINFTVENGVFKREPSKIEDNEGLNELGVEEMTDEDKAMMEMMLGDAEITSVYHMPGKVISVSHPDYKVDGNTVTYSKKWKELFNMTEIPGVEIRFEEK